MVSSRAGAYPAGKGIVNHPNPMQGAEERLRGEAKEAESGSQPRKTVGRAETLAMGAGNRNAGGPTTLRFLPRGLRRHRATQSDKRRTKACQNVLGRRI